MTEIEAFHTAVRRYCIGGGERWRKAYAELSLRNGHRIDGPDRSWQYSDEALNIFPRANVLDDIRNDVEGFIPSDFSSLEQAREILALAADAHASWRKCPTHPIEVAAMNEERAAFMDYVKTLASDVLASVRSLPWCRVIAETETRQLINVLKARWGWWYGGLSDRRESLPAHLILQDSRIDDRRAQINEMLAEGGVTRLFELTEGGHPRDVSEIDLELAGFGYIECYWLDRDAEWMVYVSHEDSITLGGAWLIEKVKQRWPDWRELIYRGYDGRGEPVM